MKEEKSDNTEDFCHTILSLSCASTWFHLHPVYQCSHLATIVRNNSLHFWRYCLSIFSHPTRSIALLPGINEHCKLRVDFLYSLDDKWKKMFQFLCYFTLDKFHPKTRLLVSLFTSPPLVIRMLHSAASCSF